jgi:hypothetical protein
VTLAARFPLLKLAAQEEPHSPIAVRFHLDKPGFVTLVVEDEQGHRLRNLVSETYFPAGDNVAWWDGLDDLERDPNSAEHAVYYIPGKLVTTGTYTVRGLYRQQIDLKYEFAIYNPGQPPWATNDTSSEWLTNHTPAGTVCFVPAGKVPAHGKRDQGSPPQVLIGSVVAEGGSGLAWVDLDGHKLHGQMWVGGLWTAALLIARDSGSHAVPGDYAYVASSAKGELRLTKFGMDKQREAKAPHDTRLGYGEDSPVLAPNWKFPKPDLESLGGMAAYNGSLIASLPKMDALLFIDVARSRVIGTFAVPKPGGLSADGQGNLFVISEKKVLKLTLPETANPQELGKPQVIVTDGLEDPQQLTIDASKNLYVSDWGKSNQVKVFAPSGKFLHSIGSPGVATSGPYDPNLMHHPKGVTIDSRNQLWVAEEDFQPKRVSVWSLDGQLRRAFYGPPTYGGGGNLDPKDKTLFYFDGMTFRLNWNTGESNLIAIQHRRKEDELQLEPDLPGDRNPGFQESGSRNKRFGASENPDLPIYLAGHKYFTNAYNSSPTIGTGLAGLWINRNGVAVPVAAFGMANYWALLQSPTFKSRIPASAKRTDPNKPQDLSGYMFVWSDLNGNGQAEPSEVTVVPGQPGAVTVSTSLAFVTSGATSYSPVSFTASGAPVYDLNKPVQLASQTQRPTSDGGGQVLATSGGWTILTTGPKPFASQSLAGAEQGVPKWSYPSLWPGLHASHISPPPEFPGELIGTTRLLGPSFPLDKVKDVELWAVNGNKGNIYLFTTDGLFVATLFKDSRSPGSSWAQRSNATRGMSVSDLTTGEENFWPSITQTEDGQVYVVTNFPAIIRVDGLDTIRRLPPSTIRVSAEMLEQARTYFESVEASRQRAAQASSTLIVPISNVPMTLDGDLSKWDPKQFVVIDERSKPVGNWGREKLQTLAALRVAGDRLCAAFKTGDSHALENSGSSIQNLFKTGGALDLMLATNPNSDPQRKSAAPGDIRLLVSLTRGKPVAVLYRPVATAGPKNSALFESPLRSVRFDDVEDVSRYLQLAKAPDRAPTASTNGASGGDFEFSIPLEVLGLKVTPGTTLRGDVGLLRGDGLRTTQRIYWSNKATGLVSDVPSEAELTPRLWGSVKFILDSRGQR